MSRNYEALTKKIVREVMNTSPSLQGVVIGDGLTNRIEGASGFRHQIDVSIEIPSEKLVLVECKHCNSKVTVSDMLVLIARIDDISKKKRKKVMGCFFTTKGYTKPAKELGKFYEIDLNTFEDVRLFAEHVAKNILIEREPSAFDIDMSGGWGCPG